MATYIEYNQLINGHAYDWSNIVINIMGTVVTGISSIDYSQEQDMQDNWGAGINPVSRGYGNRKATAKLTLYMEQLVALQTASLTGNIQDIPEFDIVVMYLSTPSIPKTDIIKNCRFKNNVRGIKLNDMNVTVDCDILCSHIIWSV